MRFEPDADHLALAEAVEALLESESSPTKVRKVADDPEGRNRELFAALADMGAFAVLASEANDGLGLGIEAQTEIALSYGRFAVSEPVIEHSLVIYVLDQIINLSLEKPSNGQDSVDFSLLKQICSRLIDGSSSATLRLDPNPNVAHLQTSDYLLDITYDNVFFGEVVEFLAGRAPTNKTSLDSTRRLSSLDKASIEATRQRLGPLLTNGSPRLRAPYLTSMASTLAAAMLIGLSQTMQKLAIEHVTSRNQFGVPIGSFQAVKHHLANVELKTSFALPVLRYSAHCLENLDVQDPKNLDEIALRAAHAKIAANEAAQLASELTLQVHGAIGYTVEHDLSIYMKKAWALMRSFGTTPQLLQKIKLHLLG